MYFLKGLYEFEYILFIYIQFQYHFGTFSDMNIYTNIMDNILYINLILYVIRNDMKTNDYIYIYKNIFQSNYIKLRRKLKRIK